MSCTDSSLAKIEDIDKFMVIVVPMVAGVISVLMVGYLANFRVMNQPKCALEEEEHLRSLDRKLEEYSNLHKEQPENKLKIEIEKANHVLSIAESIKKGARSFLTTEYKFMTVFVIIMGIIVGAATDEWEDTFVSFFIGAFLSAGCGWIGMSIAVEANVRTCEASRTGLDEALKVAFSSGAVMGLGVTGSGALALVIIYAIYGGVYQDETRYLAGFGFGASAIALFARVGGGIYTKAADVGADLVGKVEEDIPEDDPRNPATIADNVGDVAGMGADLFESFVGSIIATIQLAPS